MNHEISSADLKEILDALRASDNPRWRWIADQLEGVDITERLKRYDPPEEFREYIARICRYLREQLFLGEWYGYIRFEDPDMPMPDDPSDRYKAQIKVEIRYLYYTLRVGRAILDDWRSGNFQQIGEDLCHELCHILTEPLCQLAKADAAPSQMVYIVEVDEQQTQRIARIVTAVLPEGWWKPEYLERWHNSPGSSSKEADL